MLVLNRTKKLGHRDGALFVFGRSRWGFGSRREWVGSRMVWFVSRRGRGGTVIGLLFVEAELFSKGEV